MKILHKILKKISMYFSKLANKAYSEKPTEANLAWHSKPENEWRRYEYDLNENSLVVDVGGYKGQWAIEMFAMYRPNIIVFEPVPNQYELIKRRTLNNDKITVYPFGLLDKNTNLDLAINGDKSSLYKRFETSEKVTFKKASEFFADVEEIDLMSLNCEGSEYDLIDHFIDSGLIHKIRDLQIQFHDFFPEARNRMISARKRLSKTHYPTYSYDFVWDNWRRKQ